MPAAAPTPTLSPARPTTLQPWPQFHGVCGAELELPLVTTSTAVNEKTAGSLVITGHQPGVVDVDLGSVKPIPGLTLAADQYVSQIVSGSGAVRYSLVRSCGYRAIGTAVRTSGDGRSETLSGGLYGLLADGHGAVWGERHRSRPEAAISSALVRLDKTAPVVDIPMSLTPIGLAGDQLVATGDPLKGTPVESPLYVFNLTTHQYRLIGNSYSVTVSDGVVLWNSTACSDTGPCTLHTFTLATARETVRDYHLPLESTLSGGVFSPDHTKVVYALPEETSDRKYRSANPHDNPSDLVVLDLRTGIVDPVPNIELPPGSKPDELEFTANSRYLLIGLQVDGGTMVLAWRSGLSNPLISRFS